MISLIICIYNVSEYLQHCLKSVCTQTYSNLEIILVNDGSTDCSAQICDAYGRQDNRIKVIHKKNGGLVSARKAGLAAAHGEYIGFIDGDDWIESDMYEHLYATMLKYDVDMVESAYFCDAGFYSNKVSGKLELGYHLTEDILPIMICDEDFDECRLAPYVWSKLFKREALKNVQMQVDEQIRLGEDAAVTYPYILECKSIFILDYAGYHYIQRKGSMTQERNEDDSKSNRALISYLRRIFEKNSNADILLKQLNQYAKLLILLRQMNSLDRRNNDGILSPFGGLKQGEKVVIYAAGSLGKSIYDYLNNIKEIELVAWVDQAYEKYRKFGYQVSDPKVLENLTEVYDRVLIAIYSKRTADSVRGFLLDIGVKSEQIMWLTDEYIAENVIDPYLKMD